MCVIAQYFENMHTVPQIRSYRWNDISVLQPSDSHSNLINQKGSLSYSSSYKQLWMTDMSKDDYLIYPSIGCLIGIIALIKLESYF